MLKACCVGLIGVLALAGCAAEDAKTKESPLFKACMESISTKTDAKTQKEVCTCGAKNGEALSTDLRTVMMRYYQAPSVDEAGKELNNVPPVDRDKIYLALQCKS
jgi:hypothetical protein